MNLAVIPARGGSKRIPRKNIKEFMGKPMIAWSIQAAQSAGVFSKIIVSTDDPEIAEIAKQFGAEVPFIRPARLSDDFTGTTEVIAHGIDFLQTQGLHFNYVCCLYATAPLIQPDDIKYGLQLMQANQCNYAFTVTDFASPIFRSFEISSDGKLQMFFPEYFESRSQDLPRAFHDAGQFYWGTAQAWLNQVKIFDIDSKTIILPRWRVQDIDTEDDWIRAELLAQAIKTDVD